MDVSLGIVQKENSYLLIKRVHEIDNLTWAFPGGKKESIDKTIEDTAVREVFEETGIIFNPIHIIDSKEMPFGYLHYIFGQYESGTIKFPPEEILNCGFYLPVEIERKITTSLNPKVRTIFYR